jgi:hypothetical protein
LGYNVSYTRSVADLVPVAADAQVGVDEDGAYEDFESELGAQATVGLRVPVGFCKDGDVGDFKRHRGTELRRGRVAAYVAMGFVTPEYFKPPGYLSSSAGFDFRDVPDGLAAIGKVPVEEWLQWVVLCGLYEIVANKPNASEPGNYGCG